VLDVEVELVDRGDVVEALCQPLEADVDRSGGALQLLGYHAG